MNKITMKMNLPKIGEVDILLSEEQIKKAVEDGKNIVDKYYQNAEFKKEKVNTDDYIYNGKMTSTDTPGGFTGNKVDWKSFFPQISIDEIRNLSEKAIGYENNIKKSVVATCTLINIALASYMGNKDTQNDNMKEINGFITDFLNRKYE